MSQVSKICCPTYDLIFNVTFAMRVPWVIRAGTYTYVWRDTNNKSSIYKHSHDEPGKVPEALLRQFCVLKKCTNKFDCLVHEMLFIRQLKPSLNVQSDSIRVKVFV